MKPDGLNFMSENAICMVIEQLGWNPRDSFIKVELSGDLVFLKPDFYESGSIIASSKRAIIVADGESEVIIRNEVFSSPIKAVSKFGALILYEIDDWNWVSEKEWLIKKLSGEWIKTFSTFYDCPYRTTIRC
jgi:hypothetical protein